MKEHENINQINYVKYCLKTNLETLNVSVVCVLKLNLTT